MWPERTSIMNSDASRSSASATSLASISTDPFSIMIRVPTIPGSLFENSFDRAVNATRSRSYARNASPAQPRSLLNIWREGEAESFRGSQINNEFELCRLLHKQFGGAARTIPLPPRRRVALDLGEGPCGRYPASRPSRRAGRDGDGAFEALRLDGDGRPQGL